MWTLGHVVCDSSIIISTVPRLEERHVIPWLHLDGPHVIILLGRAWHEPERRVESLKLERLHLDASILNRPKLAKSLLERAASTLRVQLGACAHIVNPSFEKPSALIEKIQRHKLSACVPAHRWDERCREEELAAIRQTADVAGVVGVVLNRN